MLLELDTSEDMATTTTINATNTATTSLSENGQSEATKDKSPPPSTSKSMDLLLGALELPDEGTTTVPDQTTIGDPVDTDFQTAMEGDQNQKVADDGDKMAKLTGGSPILQSVIDTKQKVDTVIACSDGRIGAHRMVLAAVSPFLGILFEDQKLGEVAVLLLPDIKKSTMITLLHLAYTGQMIFKKEDVDEITSAMECLLFGQTADIKWSTVTVISPPEPMPSTSASSSDPRPVSSSSKSRQEKRKRTSSDSKQFKKPRLDENGQRVQVAYRTGNSIGKKGVMKLRKKSQKRQLDLGEGICSPPNLKSNPLTKTVAIPISTMPLLSIRIRPIEDHVCIEVSQKKIPDYLVKHRQQEEEEQQQQQAEKMKNTKDDKTVSTSKVTRTPQKTKSHDSDTLQPANDANSSGAHLNVLSSINKNVSSDCSKEQEVQLPSLKNRDNFISQTTNQETERVNSASVEKNSEDAESGIADVDTNNTNRPSEKTEMCISESENSTKSNNTIKSGPGNNGVATSSSSSGHGSDSDNQG